MKASLVAYDFRKLELNIIKYGVKSELKYPNSIGYHF